MRGMSSMEKAVILRAASALIAVGVAVGLEELMRNESSFMRPISSIVGGWTLRRMSALPKTSPQA